MGDSEITTLPDPHRDLATPGSSEQPSAAPPGRDLRRLWFWLSLCGAAVVFSFGLVLWVAVLNGDRALAAGWRFVVTCFGGTV